MFQGDLGVSASPVFHGVAMSPRCGASGHCVTAEMQSHFYAQAASKELRDGRKRARSDCHSHSHRWADAEASGHSGSSRPEVGKTERAGGRHLDDMIALLNEGMNLRELLDYLTKGPARSA